MRASPHRWPLPEGLDRGTALHDPHACTNCGLVRVYMPQRPGHAERYWVRGTWVTLTRRPDCTNRRPLRRVTDAQIAAARRELAVRYGGVYPPPGCAADLARVIVPAKGEHVGINGQGEADALNAEERRAIGGAAARLEEQLRSYAEKRVAWRAYACAAMAAGDHIMGAAEVADAMLGLEEQRFGPL